MNRKLCLIISSFAVFYCVAAGNCAGEEKWPGVDEAVIKKIAREHGREERASIIPAAEGDMQLFMFLMAGAIGGFAAGYYWRILLEGKKKESPPEQDVTP